MRPAVLLPLYQRSESLIHLSLIGMSDTQSALEVNAGIGVRHLIKSNIFGLYGFYDIRRSSKKNKIHQATIGAEWLKKYFEFRFNVYLPQKQEFSTSPVRSVLSSYRKSGSTVNVQLASFKQVEQALPGFDIDIGTQLPGLPQLTLRGAYYRFNSSDKHIEARNGFRGVLGYKLFEFLQLDGEISHDNQRKLVYFGGLTLGYNFDKGNKHSTGLTRLEKKMTILPIRDIDAVVGQGIRQYNVIDTKVTGISKDTIVAIIDPDEKKLTVLLATGNDELSVSYVDSYAGGDAGLMQEFQDSDKNVIVMSHKTAADNKKEVLYIEGLSHTESNTVVEISNNGSSSTALKNDEDECGAYLELFTTVDFKEYHRLQEKLTQKQDELLDMREDELQRREDEYNEQLKRDKDGLSQGQENLEELQRQIEELRRQNATLRRQHTRTQNRNSGDFSHLTDLLSDARSSNSRLSKQQHHMLSNIDGLQEEVERLKESQRKAQASNSGLSKQLSRQQYSMSSNIDGLQEKVERLKESQRKAQDAFQQRSDQYANELQAERKRLFETKRNLLQNKMQHGAESKSLSTRVNELEEALDDRVQQILLLRTDVHDRDERIRRLEFHTDYKRKEKIGVEFAFENLQSRINFLETQVVTLTEQLQQKTKSRSSKFAKWKKSFHL